VQFKTPVGDGFGDVEFSPDGRLRGGDATFAYDGSWSQEGERFKAVLSAERVVSGPPGVFGMDQVEGRRADEVVGRPMPLAGPRLRAWRLHGN
jgi:hypothetical protein